MPSVHEQLTEQFCRWELRGRGWQVYHSPVTPEPPFRPFDGHYLPPQPAIDDGRRPTALSSLVAKLSRSLSGKSESPPAIEEEPEPEPEVLIRDPLIELQTFLPANLDISREVFAQFLSSLSRCHEPVTFELLGLEPRITAQFAVHPRDVSMARQQLHAFFHDAVFTPQQSTLEQAWNEIGDADIAVIEFGLEKEFMHSLATSKLDPFVAIIGALAELQPGDLGLFQVIFQPVQHPWAESIVRSVTHSDGKSFFVNAPELAAAAKEKTWYPLYAAVLRIAAKSGEPNRPWEIAQHLASALSVFSNPTGNALVPLSNEDYPFENHVEDVLRRQSRRSGMLLSSEELISFVHFPSPAVTSPKLERQTTTTKRAPNIVLQPTGLLLGNNEHAGQALPVRLTPEQRVRHLHAIGASGTGKSTLLFNLIRQDIENGEGVAVLDPHGDLVNKLLGIIPTSRVEDVILLDPSDEEYSIGFNILSAHSELEKNLLASDLVSVFQRLSSSWGDQMGSVLNNAIRAFLESNRGGTLADLRRFLLDPAFRNEFLKTVSDPELLYYWQKGFAQLSGNKSIGPVLTRLETFLSPKPVRYMVSQPVNRLDFKEIMDTGKVFLAKLAQGEIGKENSYLLGSLLVSKFQQMAMSRQRQAVRKDYWLYVDEFQNFITPSMTEILTGARKYRLGLILAHQELRQLERDREVASAVLSNCHTRVVFRVGDDDARKLSDGFAFFEARDLQNLEIGKAICRVERSDYDFNLSVPFPGDGDLGEAEDRSQQVITASRKKYGTPRAEIEMALRGLQEQPAKQDDVGGPSVSLQPRSRPPQPTPTAPPLPAEPTIRKPSEPPKVSEVPKPEPAVAQEPKRVHAESGKGIGGHQHNLVRERIEAAAKPLGFYPARERLVQDGGKIDLALERPGQFIGCEISFETTIDHEVGNIAKCLKAGCHHVAVICASETRLAKIQHAVAACLDAVDVSRVGYYLPEQFLARLPELIPQESPPPCAEPVRLGKYTVKRHGPALTRQERNAREEAAIRVMAESMKRKP